MKFLYQQFKNFFLVLFLAFYLTGCGPKVWDYNVTKNTPFITDEKLKKMNIQDFFHFMQVKNIRDYVPNMTYTYADAYEFSNRYCSLRGSKLLLFKSEFKDLDLSYIDGTLERYDRKMDSPVSYACYIKESNEFFTLTRVRHFIVKNLYMSHFEENYVLNTSLAQLTWYLKYLEDEEYKYYSKYSRKGKEEIFTKTAKSTRDRKGTFIVNIFEDSVYSPKDGLAHDCSFACKKQNIIETGYTEKRYLLLGNWTIVKNVEPLVKKIDSTCSCVGNRTVITK